MLSTNSKLSSFKCFYFFILYVFLKFNIYPISLQVPFSRSSLNHDDVFVLDTESTIFQFNGETSRIQERGKALEVVQYIKDTYHDGKCEIIIVGKGSVEGSNVDSACRKT